MDTNLNDTQLAVQESVEKFFARECPLDRVMSAEPLGFDEDLWAGATTMGLPVLGVPEDQGGQGAETVDLMLTAMAAGRALAPIPLVETMVANRLLAGCSVAADAIPGEIVTIVPRLVREGPVPAVPAGAVADQMVTFDGAQLVLSTLTGPRPRRSPTNLGSMPIASGVVTGDAVVLAQGDDAARMFASALREWKLLTAAALTGLGQHALAIALEYVKVRKAFGTVIGSFQGVAHPLVDDTVALDGAYLLCLEAAWSLDEATADADYLTGMAYYHAVEAARQASADALHVHGGLGFTLEATPQLFLRRAKAWPLVCGDPEDELDAIASHMIRRSLEEES